MLLALLSLAPTLATEWQSPPEEVLDVLHAPDLPWVWTAPSGEHLLLADPVTYAPLADYAAGWPIPYDRLSRILHREGLRERTWFAPRAA